MGLITNLKETLCRKGLGLMLRGEVGLAQRLWLAI